MREKYNDSKWTRGRFNSFVTSLLRSGSRKWEPKYTVLNEAKTERKTNEETGRLAQHYLCNGCQKDFPAKQVEVDHILPVGRDKSWDESIEGLFCEKENLQVLCKKCHLTKTKQENLLRKTNAK